VNSNKTLVLESDRKIFYSQLKAIYLMRKRDHTYDEIIKTPEL
jgi:hypothetical protein